MSKFPKNIHQIWLQGILYISESNNKNIENIKKMHPNWNYYLWDEIKILELIKNDKQIIEKYYKFIYLHQKVDFMKIVILNKIGGIYLDIDCEVRKKLDSLIEKFSEYDMIVSYLHSKISSVSKFGTCGSFDSCINNGVILAKPLTDISNYLIENFQTNCNFYEPKIVCIQNTTGPTIFNKLINSYIKNINKSKILILPHNYLEPCINSECDIDENTYVIHKHEFSWLSNDQKYLLDFYLKYESVIIVIVIFIIIGLIYIFMKK